MKRKHHGRIIDTSIRLKTTPMKAWEAWADPRQIANWFVDRAEGEARAGSTMRWFFEAFNYALDVPVIEAQPGRTFVTGGGPQPGPDGLPYLMEITIAKDGDATVVNLVNSGFSEKPEKDGNFRDTQSGWAGALTTMKVWLEQYPEMTRRRTIVMRPAAHAPDRLQALYAHPDGRQQWLAPDLPVDGQILDTGTEVLLEWPAERALLGLKSFDMGPQQMVALDLSVWSAAAPAATPTSATGATADREARMNRALDRLVKLL
jgi:uncharacterized protein YndB with AHSA1/START domain